MRIWDVHPGYLNRQSLLGEHRELHGIVSILVNGKRGYSSHPETLRWVGHGWALRMRHEQLACEMALRGYRDKSPVRSRGRKGVWPDTYIDWPEQQFSLLKDKYKSREKGRIPLPEDTGQLWAQHKHSVLARDPALYRKIGRNVASGALSFEDLARLLVELLRESPEPEGLRKAVQQMWELVNENGEGALEDGCRRWSTRRLLLGTQERAMANDVSFLIHSTALSELMVWL